MLTYQVRKGVLNIKLSGELDHAVSTTLRPQMDKLLKENHYEMIVFDFSELGFMDSAGVGLLLGRLKTAKSLCKPVAILSPTPAVDKVLAVSGIYTIIPKIS